MSLHRHPCHPPKSNIWESILCFHYDDVIMSLIASQITSLTIVYSIVYSDADQRNHQSSASLAFVWGIHRGPVNSPHKWPVTRKMFPFDDVIMKPKPFRCCSSARFRLSTALHARSSGSDSLSLQSLVQIWTKNILAVTRLCHFRLSYGPSPSTCSLIFNGAFERQ